MMNKKVIESIDQYLQDKMKGFTYTFADAVKIIGCGEKVLRRYMEAQYVQPVKQSDRWLFDNETIEKANFLHKCGNPLGIAVETSLGIYDYLKSKGISINIKEFREFATNYWLKETEGK